MKGDESIRFRQTGHVCLCVCNITAAQDMGSKRPVGGQRGAAVYLNMPTTPHLCSHAPILHHLPLPMTSSNTKNRSTQWKSPDVVRVPVWMSSLHKQGFPAVPRCLVTECSLDESGPAVDQAARCMTPPQTASEAAGGVTEPAATKKRIEVFEQIRSFISLADAFI